MPDIDVAAIVAGQPVDEGINATVVALRVFEDAGGKYAGRVYSGLNGGLDLALRERYPAALLVLLGALSYADLITVSVQGAETPSQVITRLAQLYGVLPYDTVAAPVAAPEDTPAAA